MKRLNLKKIKIKIKNLHETRAHRARVPKRRYRVLKRHYIAP